MPLSATARRSWTTDFALRLGDEVSDAVELALGCLGSFELEQRRYGLLGRSVEECLVHISERSTSCGVFTTARAIDECAIVFHVDHASLRLQSPKHCPYRLISRRIRAAFHHFGDRRFSFLEKDVHDL